MPPGAVVKVLSKDPSSGVNSENILRQKPSSSLSTSHRLLRRQQQFEQQQKLTEKLEKDILEVSLDNEEKEEVDNNKRDAGGEDKYNNNIGMDRSASGAYLSGKIEPLRIASPVLSVDNAFGSVWSSSKNAMVNANTDGGVVADTASTLPAQSNTNDDPLFGLDSLDEATATPTTTTIGGERGMPPRRPLEVTTHGSGVNISNISRMDNARGLCHRLRRHISTSPRRYRTT